MRFVADLNCAMTKEKRGDINLLELKDEDNPKFNEFIDSATYPKKKIYIYIYIWGRMEIK